MNLNFDQLHKLEKKLLLYEPLYFEEHPEVQTSISNIGINPEDELILREEYRLLKECVNKLTDRLRKLFFILLEESEYKKIAKMFSTNENNVRKMRHRMKEILQKCLDDYYF